MKKTIFCLVCFFFVSQTYAQQQKVSIEIINGISLVNGDFKDFVENGFNNELSISKSFCDKLSLGMGVKHSSFNVRQEFGQTHGSRNQFRSLGFDLGPQFNFGSDKLSLKLYGRTGFMVNSTPEILQMHPNTNITTGSLKQQSVTALSARFGAKINSELCNGLEFFISSEYATSFQADLTYYSKDISKAIGADGRIDPDLASEIPTSPTNFNFSSLNVNFGISIQLGKMGNHPNRRSSNPLYQGNQNKGENPMYQERGSNNNPLYQETGNSANNPMYEQGISGGGGHAGQSSGSRAQDYNSSRSNNSSGIIANPDTGNSKAVQAQDYNSSRSNTTSAIELEEDKKDFDGNEQKAQDYNSSRSNNSSGIIANPDTGNSKAVQAQDYNSSRSNNIEAVGENPNQGATKAQDYNSSRSNTTAAIDTGNDIRESMTAKEKRKMIHKLKKEERKRLKSKNTKGVQAQDYNSSRSNNIEAVGGNPNQGATRAQDYNSSRSNTTSAIDSGDDIRESMLASEKRKIKRKLRKEEKKRLKEERRRRKLQATEIY